MRSLKGKISMREPAKTGMTKVHDNISVDVLRGDLVHAATKKTRSVEQLLQAAENANLPYVVSAST